MPEFGFGYRPFPEFGIRVGIPTISGIRIGIPRIRVPRNLESRIRNSSAASTGDSLSYRFGEPKDRLAIAAAMLKEKMNPLSLGHERFIVCETAAGERVGFGQVPPTFARSCVTRQLKSFPLLTI